MRLSNPNKVSPRTIWRVGEMCRKIFIKEAHFPKEGGEKQLFTTLSILGVWLCKGANRIRLLPEGGISPIERLIVEWQIICKGIEIDAQEKHRNRLQISNFLNEEFEPGLRAAIATILNSAPVLRTLRPRRGCQLRTWRSRPHQDIFSCSARKAHILAAQLRGRIWFADGSCRE
jgi:hypothetical protein